MGINLEKQVRTFNRCLNPANHKVPFSEFVLNLSDLQLKLPI